jgi:hypothetical protein
MSNAQQPTAPLVRTGARSALVALIAALLVLFAPAAAATAHSGPWELTVTPDGAGGLSAFGTYTEDGHTVTEIIDPVATAVASDGRTAGPVSLVSSAEGEGLWVTPEPFLDEGEWTVTVATTTPAAVTATTAVTVQPLSPPADPDDASTTTGATDDGADESANAASPDAAGEGSAMPTVLWIIVGLVALAAVVVAVIVVLRRRSVAGGRPRV